MVTIKGGEKIDVWNSLSSAKAAFGLVVLWGSLGQAWSHHHLITKGSLESVPQFQEKVIVTNFKDLIKDLVWRNVTFSDPAAFNRAIQIRKEYEFSFQVGERIGQPISILEILSKYSDEPDWGMDKELFGEDQFPHLWKDEYVMMGGKTGTPSQAFRHMYWAPLSFKEPLNTFKLPLSKLFASMGEAPIRGQVFLDLAREAFEKKHPYWAWRFLANGFHYFQDVAQPFHSAQTPTKKFILMPFLDSEKGEGFKGFIGQMTQIISYYHFAFEDYIGRLMDEFTEGNNGEAERLYQALRFPKESEGLFVGKAHSFAILIESVADISVGLSDEAGRTSIDFFPEISGKFSEAKPSEIVKDPVWWDEVKKRGQGASPEKEVYFKTVEEMFRMMGEATRSAASVLVPN